MATGVAAALALFAGCEASRLPGPGSEGDDVAGSESSDSSDGGSGECQPHEIVCSNKCVDPNTSHNDCGGCRNVCLHGADCVDGECGPAFGPCWYSKEYLTNCTAICADAGGSCVEGGCGVFVGEVYLDGSECLEATSTKFTQTCDEVFPYLMTSVKCCCQLPPA